MGIKVAKLPSVEKFLSRLNECGKRVIDKNFCNKTSEGWIWEAYAFRMWRTFESFDKAGAPYVIATAIGNDGIVMDEQIKDRKLSRCRFYADRDIPYEMRYQNPDIFEPNQYAEKTVSWGPQGAILPYTNSSSVWKSLIDEEGFGILCFYDELWAGSYVYSANSGANFGQVWFDVLFRPRQISKSDLLLFLFKEQCRRGCFDETVLPYPCIQFKDCVTSTTLPNFDDVKDDDTIVLPNGKEVTGKEYKKRLEDRADYEKPCITTCEKVGRCDCNEIESIKSEIVKLNSTISSKNKEITELNNTIISKNHFINNLQSAISEYTSNLDKCHKSLNDYAVNVSKLKSENDTLKSKITTLEKQNKDLEMKLNIHKSSLESLLDTNIMELTFHFILSRMNDRVKRSKTYRIDYTFIEFYVKNYDLLVYDDDEKIKEFQSKISENLNAYQPLSFLLILISYLNILVEPIEPVRPGYPSYLNNYKVFSPDFCQNLHIEYLNKFQKLETSINFKLSDPIYKLSNFIDRPSKPNIKILLQSQPPAHDEFEGDDAEQSDDEIPSTQLPHDESKESGFVSSQHTSEPMESDPADVSNAGV